MDETSASSLRGRSVAEFVRRGIVTCAPDAGLGEVARAMADNRVHAIFVGDDDPASEPAAILDTDLVAAIATGHHEHFRAANFASANAPTVFLDDDLARAVELIADRRVSHLVVRAADQTPLGVLSTLDIARAFAGLAPEDDSA